MESQYLKNEIENMVKLIDSSPKAAKNKIGVQKQKNK
jgi:hypothetical protein